MVPRGIHPFSDLSRRRASSTELKRRVQPRWSLIALRDQVPLPRGDPTSSPHIRIYIYIPWVHISRIVCHEQRRTLPPSPPKYIRFAIQKLHTWRFDHLWRFARHEGKRGKAGSNLFEINERPQKTSMASLDKRGTKLSGTMENSRRRRRRDDGDFSRRGWLDVSAEAEIKRYGDTRRDEREREKRDVCARARSIRKHANFKRHSTTPMCPNA